MMTKLVTRRFRYFNSIFRSNFRAPKFQRAIRGPCPQHLYGWQGKIKYPGKWHSAIFDWSAEFNRKLIPKVRHRLCGNWRRLCMALRTYDVTFAELIFNLKRKHLFGIYAAAGTDAIGEISIIRYRSYSYFCDRRANVNS